jgi:hypothetical protein
MSETLEDVIGSIDALVLQATHEYVVERSNKAIHSTVDAFISNRLQRRYGRLEVWWKNWQFTPIADSDSTFEQPVMEHLLHSTIEYFKSGGAVLIKDLAEIHYKHRGIVSDIGSASLMHEFVQWGLLPRLNRYSNKVRTLSSLFKHYGIEDCYFNLRPLFVKQYPNYVPAAYAVDGLHFILANENAVEWIRQRIQQLRIRRESVPTFTTDEKVSFIQQQLATL